MKEYDKLVRDRIPEIIREDGEKPVVERLSDSEVQGYVLDKIVEEARELREDASAEELVDLIEAVERFRELEDLDEEEIARLREGKASERGVFDENIVLKEVRD